MLYQVYVFLRHLLLYNQVLSKFYSAIGTYEDDLTLYYALCKEFGEDESIKNVNRLIKEIGRY